MDRVKDEASIPGLAPHPCSLDAAVAQSTGWWRSVHAPHPLPIIHGEGRQADAGQVDGGQGKQAQTQNGSRKGREGRQGGGASCWAWPSPAWPDPALHRQWGRPSPKMAMGIAGELHRAQPGPTMALGWGCTGPSPVQPCNSSRQSGGRGAPGPAPQQQRAEEGYHQAQHGPAPRRQRGLGSRLNPIAEGRKGGAGPVPEGERGWEGQR